MDKHTLLQHYIDFAYKHNYKLNVTGKSKRVSKIWVISYDEVKINGRFVLSGEEMTYRYANIDSCKFTTEKEQEEFDIYMLCVEAYGDMAEDKMKRFELYKEYYQQIVLKRAGHENSEGIDLKKLTFERLNTIFAHALRSTDSLLAHYIARCPFADSDKIEDEPILLLSRSNLSQKEAIETALAERISVIEGPPGTGKTTTILSILANLVARGKRVVVVSKNNSAIDNIKEELDAQQLPPFYLRLGEKGIIKDLDKTLKPMLQDILDCIELLSETEVDSSTFYRLYSEMRVLEEDINHLVELKNKVLEDQNVLRHVEKRNAAFGENRIFPNIEKFQNRSLEHMRREIDRIAMGLQKVYYNGHCSLWDRLKNRLVWRLNMADFKTDGLLLLFQLERLFLVREIEELTAELELSDLQDKQAKLAELYDHQYIQESRVVIQSILRRFYGSEDLTESIRQITETEIENIYKTHKHAIRNIFPVILTTADALVFNFNDLVKSGEKIDYIIIDEASQCDLITGLSVLALADHCVIVGDRKQLNAITEEYSVRQFEIESEYDYFHENLLSSVQKVFSPHSTLLREHYRCDYSIINYCNKFYYDNELIIYTQAHDDAMKIVNVDQGKYAQRAASSGSFYNDREIKTIEGLAGPMLDKTYVITPFKAQGESLRQHFHCGKDICGTIHTFQGKGEDTVYFSTVLNDLPFANSCLSVKSS